MKKYFFFIFIHTIFLAQAQSSLKYLRAGRSIIFTNAAGEKLRLTPYGDDMIRVQMVRKNESFFADDHYEMVVSHNWPGNLDLSKTKDGFEMSTAAKDGMSLILDQSKMTLSFSFQKNAAPFLKQDRSISWDADTIRASFENDPSEHFTGLGHGYYGKEESIDLQGKLMHRNYGTEHGQQAPLIVPYYLSSKGYGIFLNSSFPNTFSFGDRDHYEFSIYGDGRMDFFVITGPEFSKIMDRYTQLTGRPRMPLKAFFGLALSDKGNDHTSSDPSDEKWWKKKITQHREAGFPIDHIINDNRWRAGGGQRCESYFAWDSIRYPDPREYATWMHANGLITTLDFNRCISVKSEGWKASYNIPNSDGIEFNTSAPDFTRKEVRDWFWNLMWKKSLDPKLGYPGDALWIDEFDEMGKASPQMKFSDGTIWLERRNYWFFLIAKSLVQQGWDKYFKGSKRPFVWVRGMTAGAQRYATLWSGDIESNYSDMKTQLRALQLAGLSGFPFWGHDAGGFRSDDLEKNPTDNLYRQWSMAFGSFTPFWKPHGIGLSRWPLDRPLEVQKDAKKYCDLRYELMPYIYSYAHVASETGTPMARAMVFDHPKDAVAWKTDLQYMWGDELLVAPNCSEDHHVQVWLPKGQWYDFWNDEKINGDKNFQYSSPIGVLPLFVKAGAIIPMSNFALSTSFISGDSLTLRVYVGDNGNFILYEDDGVTEAYKKNEKRTTTFLFDQASMRLTIKAAKGNYKNAPADKVYRIEFHGLENPVDLEVNGIVIKTIQKNNNEKLSQTAVWDRDKKILSLFLKKMSVHQEIIIKKIAE